jgi:hypothetical protein
LADGHDAERLHPGLVLLLAVREIDESLIAGDPEDHIGVAGLFLFGGRCLADEAFAGQAMKRDRLRLAFLVDEIVAAVGAALHRDDLVLLVVVAVRPLIGLVTPAVAERRGRAFHGKLGRFG